MNCKISKFFFAALLMGMSGIGHSQTEEGLKKILEETDVEFLKNYAAEKEAEFLRTYDDAVAKAKDLGLPISGTDKKGNYFELVGFLEGTENLRYYKTNSVSQKEFYNNVEDGSSLTTLSAHYLHDQGVLGAGMIVGEWDGGIPFSATWDLSAARVIRKDTGASEVTTNGAYHATHVAGTMISKGENIPVTKGFLPQGTLWANTWDSDESEMAAQAAQGLLQSNHSYGIDFSRLSQLGGVEYLGQYGSAARAIDVITNAAPYYTPVYAAGNARGEGYNASKGGRDLLAEAGVSKNTITVAAVNGVQSYVSASSVTMSSFSCWGPSDDYRIKPDISAKGVNVLSYDNTGATEVESGTSMAAPAVTGAIGLWQSFYYQKTGSYLRSASVRALMAHTAKEAGPSAGPDYMFGWGLMNVEGGAKIIEGLEDRSTFMYEKNLSDGSEFEYTFDYSGAEPLVATLAWNDPAGVPMSGPDTSIPVLVNDLDLRIINVETEEEYYPWHLVKSWETTGSGIAAKGDNNVDNIEKIETGIIPQGQYKAVVSHKRNLNSGNDQNFTLIISGTGTVLSNEKVELTGVKVYPNPASDILNVDVSSAVNSAVSVEVFDIRGAKVKELKNVSGLIPVNVSDLSTGIYHIRIHSEEGIKTVKFAKR